MRLDQMITEVKGIGPELAKKFARLGVANINELVHNYPRRYEDYSVITPIAHIKPGVVTIEATITQAKGHYVRRGMHVTEAIAQDKTASVRLVWFNQPYRANSFKSGQLYFISGNFELSYQRFSIMNPSVELTSDFPINTARIVPIYPEIKGLNSNQIRKAVKQILPVVHSLDEMLPAHILLEHNLMSRAKAVEMMHFPSSSEVLLEAQRSLGFEEVFALALASLLNKHDLLQQQAPAVGFEQRIAQDFVTYLPFLLTDAQRKVVWQIYQDMARTSPMNRLVEGDVGAGKTVVAAMAAAMVLHHGHQVALMAPTELLARQHAETLSKLLSPIGFGDKVGLLVGSMTASQKTHARKAIAEGHMQFIVGTHALIQEKVDMHSLELVIVDEQHRFGVEQRKKLQAKAGHMPHVLSLTATPIPRSLALTLYGELDISVLDSKPSNRKRIITEICSPNSRVQLYAKVEAELEKGRQVFVVCPLITESETKAAHSVEKMHDQLRSKHFKHRRVGLLHGKLPAEEKQEIMRQFVAHEIDVLVSTTVIEVGVDVPNATVMIIEGADQFGLAQMHQLRGRVGRSEHQGYCYVMPSDSRPPTKRLRALASSDDGFRLAELDLELRGPGAIYGQSQHGALDLRIAKLTDTALIAAARKAAQNCIDRRIDLLQYPELYARVQRLRAVTNLN